MIDKDGYRLNVGIVLINKRGNLFWGKRAKAQGWQFPQGGVGAYETLAETMYRELGEELGLSHLDVKILGVTRQWTRYKLPPHMRRPTQIPLCIGQKQRWFLVRFLSDDNKINLFATATPEFSSWHWIEYWAPLLQVIYFKRSTYRKVLAEFASVVKP